MADSNYDRTISIHLLAIFLTLFVCIIIALAYFAWSFLFAPVIVLFLIFVAASLYFYFKLHKWYANIQYFSEHFKSCRSVLIQMCYADGIIHIVAGLLGQSVLFGLTIYMCYRDKGENKGFNFGFFIKHKEIAFVYCAYSIVFIAYVSSPLWKSIVSLEETFRNGFKDSLGKYIQMMEDHFIAVGYGRFGNTVIRNLLENWISKDAVYSERLFSYSESVKMREGFKNKPKLLLVRMLNEKCKEILFCTNLLVVDKNESLFDFVHEHPIFGKIGVIINEPKKGYLDQLQLNEKDTNKKIYIPAIVGNVEDISILSFIKVHNSRMLLGMVPDPKASTTLFEVIKEKKEGGKRGILSISDTDVEFSLIPLSHNTEVDFLQGFRISGWEVSDVAFANYIKQKEYNEVSNPKILILGRGKQLNFIIEKIWLENYKDIKFLENNCLIITEDEYINKATIINENGKRFWYHRMDHVIGIKLDDKDYLAKIPCINALPTRPSLLEDIISGKADENKAPWGVIGFKGLSQPDIIIISSDVPSEITKSLHNVNNIIMRLKLKEAKAPIVIVESSPQSSHFIKMAMERYANNTKNVISIRDTAKPWNSTYPMPLLSRPPSVNHSENIVGAFDLADTIVRGYAEAMSHENGTVLRACIRDDQAGSFRKFCFLLAGLEVDGTEKFSNILIPSFHNTNTLSQREKHFCFFTNADLALGDNAAIMDRNNTDYIHAVFASTGNDDIRKGIINGPDPLIPKKECKLAGKCPKLALCPISSIVQSKDADPDPSSKQKKEDAVRLNTLTGEGAQPSRRNESLARLYGCCYNDDVPGSLAAVLHKLLLQDCNKLRPYEKTNKVFNIHSTVNTECYNHQFSLLRLNGVLALREKRPEINKIFSNCLQGVVISPVKRNKDWYNYAKQLAKINNFGIYDDGRKLGRSDAPCNILLITREYENSLRTSCPVSINKCPFKSKALYLLP